MSGFDLDCFFAQTLDAPLDLGRTLAIGHSAGGQLALWAAGTGAVGTAVSLGGVAELAVAARAGIGQGAAAEFMGGMPEQRPEAYALADPRAAAGDAVELIELEGVGHFEPIDPRSSAWARVVAALA